MPYLTHFARSHLIKISNIKKNGCLFDFAWFNVDLSTNAQCSDTLLANFAVLLTRHLIELDGNLINLGSSSQAVFIPILINLARSYSVRELNLSIGTWYFTNVVTEKEVSLFRLVGETNENISPKSITCSKYGMVVGIYYNRFSSERNEYIMIFRNREFVLFIREIQY